MSRVHDALRRAGAGGCFLRRPAAYKPKRALPLIIDPGPSLGGLLEQQEIPFRTAADSLLIDVSRPHEAPMEEFRDAAYAPEP